MNKEIKYIDKIDLVDKFLLLVNHIASPPIIPHERKILLEFLRLPDEIYQHKRFNSVAKKLVAKSLNTSLINVTTVVQRLIKKGYLRRDTDKVIYPAKFIEYLLKSKTKFEVSFHFSQADSTDTGANS